MGYDAREAAVFTVFNQSVIQHTVANVAFHPLFGEQKDGTTAFTYARYLIPHLRDYKGFAIWCDGDMIVRRNIEQLWDLRDKNKAVQVVKHEYKTQAPRKFIGTPMEDHNYDYPRKNWSSVIIFNCEHPSNRILTPELVDEAGGHFLHTFAWLNDNEIGSLPVEWNWLVGEYEENPDAKLLHWTHGAPGFQHYANTEGSLEFNAHLLDAINMAGECPEEMVRRAGWRIPEVGSYNRQRDPRNGSRRLPSQG